VEGVTVAADSDRAEQAAPGADSFDAVVDDPTARADMPTRRRGGRIGAWLKESAIIVVSALVLSMLIKTFLVQSFYIPTGSMEDTLAIGDRVVVSKLAPGPLDIHRGDIVAFKDPGGWLAESVAPERSGWRQATVDVLTYVGLLPQDSGEHLIKRAIGLPGDTVECCDAQGRLTVNGVSIDEPYLAPGSSPSEVEFSIVVPEDRLWVMGDNRQNSQDSRYHRGDPGGGSIPMDSVVGVAFLTLWPVDRWSVLHNPGDTFREVP
jgi:signal peptidase I